MERDRTKRSTRILTALPVYNEAGHISNVLDEVLRFSRDVLVIDDGSTDRTPEILAARTDVQLLQHESNRGYGAALASAFAYAMDHNYDILVTIDCDGQHEPRLIPELASRLFPDGVRDREDEDHPSTPPSDSQNPLRQPDDEDRIDWNLADDGSALDIVSGSRYLKTFPGDTVPPEERRQINMSVTAMLKDCVNLSLTDSFCGFKAYRVAALGCFDITEPGYAMPLQIWVQAVAAGLRIEEFPVPLIYLEEERSFGGSLDDSRRRMAYYTEVLKREMQHLSLSCGERSV